MNVITSRFWSRVQKTNSCWLWTGARNANGYGRFFTSRSGILPRMMYAHRYSWMLSRGALSEECILHRCDNRTCVNPEHLFAGSRESNQQDMTIKGRAAKKLSPLQVEEIRRDFDSGRCTNKSALARRFGVHPRMVDFIVSRRWWKQAEQMAVAV